MTRNWGGDGIEKFLDSDERVILRFGNHFLTDSRYARYRTISSVFEFHNLDAMEFKKMENTKIPLIVALILELFFLLFPLSMYFLAGGSIMSVVIGVSQIVFIYPLYRFWSLFRKDCYVVASKDHPRRWKIPTFGTGEGLVFVDELVKAVNIKKGEQH